MTIGIKTEALWKSSANLGRNMIFRDRALSPDKGTSIWESCPQLAGLDPAVGIQFFEDFLTLGLDDTTRNPTEWKWISDTATDSITLPKLGGGVVNVACGGTDNNETYIQAGGAACDTAAPFVITAANSKPLWLSAYVKAVEHADEAIFVGLAEEGSAAANFMTDDSGVLADKDFIGFNLLTATPEAWNVTWKKTGQAVQAITGVAVNADDWHLFEFMYDGVATVYFYVDRVLVSTQALATAATFPSGEPLAPIIAVKTGEGTAKNVQVDYMKIFQRR